MANITRIKNNQITDATIEYTKIKSGTLVGSVFNSNLTLNSNVTVIGNLSVTGNTSTINSTNTLVNDPLVIFNNGYVGTPSYDIGIIANRNLQTLAPYGSVNMAWIWEETAQQWQAVATTETGTTTGAINNSGFANLRVGNAIVQTVTVSNSVSVGTTLSVTGTTNHVGAVTMTTATTGGLQAVAIGNVTPGSGAFTTGTFSSTLGVTGATTLTTATAGGLQAVAIGNVTPGTGAFTSLTASGSFGVTGALTFTTATGGGLQAVAIGNVTPGTGAFTTLSSTGATTLGLTSAVAINSTPIGNATPSSGAFTTLSASSTLGVTGATTLTTATTGGLQAVAIGNVTPGTAQFTTLGASGATTLNTVTGASFQGVIGNVTPAAANFTTIGASGASTLNTVTGASFQGVIGNVTPNTGAFTTVTTGGLQSVAIGNVTPGTGAFTSLSAQTETVGGLQAVAIGNVTPGTAQFTTLGASGASTLNTITGASFQGVIGNVTPNTGAFTTVTTGGLQAAAIGNVTPGTGAFTTLSASTWANITSATESTTTSTGALVTAGGVGIAKNLNVGGSAVIAGNLTVQGTMTAIQSQTLDVTDLNITVAKGAINAAAANGAGLTVDAAGATITYASADDSWNFNKLLKGTSATFNTITTGGLQAVAIGNVTPGTGAFTAGTFNTATTGGLQAVAIGNVTPGTGAFTTLSAQTETVGGLQAVAIGNVTPGTAVFTTTTTGGLQAVAIGNVTPGTAQFTTLGASGATTLNTATAASLQATAIGNVTPGTGAFTTLTTTGAFTSTGNIVAAATTPSTSINTGSLITKGGVGIDGNINAGVVNTSIHALYGNVLIGRGTAASADSALTISLNTDVPIPAFAQVHLSGGSNRSAAMVIDSFGTAQSSVYTGRHSRGTSTTPTAVQANDEIANFLGRGYGATGYVNSDIYNAPGLTILAAENYTDTAQGAYLKLNVTKTGSNSAVMAMKLDSNGNVVIPALTPSVDYTTGALVLTSGGLGVNGNVHANGDCHVSGSFNGSDVAITGTFSSTDTTDTTTPGIGTINVPGGASIGGNTYIGKNLYIGPAAFDKNLTVPTIIAVDNGTAYAQMAIVNSAGSGSSDFAAYAANGSDAGGWVDMGIAGNAFSDSNYTITSAQDGYLFTRPTGSVAGGNLVLATSEAGSYNDIVIATGSFFSNSEVARFHGNTSNSGTFVVKLPTPNTATANTGAFQVWGGASISGNSYIGGGAIINGSQTAGYDFKAMGKNSTNLLWARPSATYDQVIIGNTISAASLTGGAKLQINSTDSILLPTGTTAQRPSSTGFTDVQGMFRYNTTIGAIEFYSGSTWQSVSTSFTVITDEQYNGDGSTVAFTMAASSTTAATIVSINGVIQIPTLAYSVSGTTLTFTEAPASGDLIDVRRLTTTQTVQNITSTNGYMQFQVDNSGAYVYTGTSGTRATTYWEPNGAEVGGVANVSVASANTLTTIDTIDNTAYRSAKYLIQVTNGTNYQVSEALVVSNGTTATIVSYGVVQTNGNLGIVTATQSSTNTLVQFVAANASNQVRIKKTYMLI
jgi:hypothetical protein